MENPKMLQKNDRKEGSEESSTAKHPNTEKQRLPSLDADEAIAENIHRQTLEKIPEKKNTKNYTNVRSDSYDYTKSAIFTNAASPGSYIFPSLKRGTVSKSTTAGYSTTAIKFDSHRNSEDTPSHLSSRRSHEASSLGQVHFTDTLPSAKKFNVNKIEKTQPEMKLQPKLRKRKRSLHYRKSLLAIQDEVTPRHWAIKSTLKNKPPIHQKVDIFQKDYSETSVISIEEATPSIEFFDKEIKSDMTLIDSNDLRQLEIIEKAEEEKNLKEQIRANETRDKVKINFNAWFYSSFYISASSGSLSCPRPDASWLIKNDPVEDEDLTQHLWPKEKRVCFLLAFLPYWMSLFFMGRLPFIFTYSRKQNTYVCRMERTNVRFRQFLFTSIFIFIASFLFIVSFLYQFEEYSHDVVPPPYKQLEVLLFEKHWLSVVIHMTMLVLSCISSVIILVKGNSIAKYITEFDSSCRTLRYDPYIDIKIYPYVEILLLGISGVTRSVFFYWNLCGVKESVQINTIIYFRLFATELYFTWYFPYLCWGVVCMQVYAVFCARSFFHMLVYYSKAICNLAKQWNEQTEEFFATRNTILNPVKPGKGAAKNQNQPKITHSAMFDSHIIIMDIVRSASKTFSVIVLSYYCFQILDFTFEALNLSNVIIPPKRPPETLANHSTINNLRSDDKIKYKETTSHRLSEVFYYMLPTITGFFFTSASISSVGETIMNGSHIIQKYNLMSSKNSKDRRFVLSMEMSFSRKRTPAIRPGGYFGINRVFILNAIGGALFLTSLMIQVQVQPLIRQPIVFPCTSNPSGTCFGVQTVKKSEVDFKGIADKLKEVVEAAPAPPTPGTTPATEEDKTIKIPQDKIPDILRATDFMAMKEAERPGQDTAITNASSFDSHCTAYCPNSQVRHILTYFGGGYTKKKVELPAKVDDCIFRPYAARPGNHLCTGNRLSGKDVCGMYDTNPFWTEETPPMKLIPLPVSGGIPPKRCYAGLPTGQAIDTVHPLQLAGFPYTSIPKLETATVANIPLPEILNVEQNDNMRNLTCKVNTIGRDYTNVVGNFSYMLNITHSSENFTMLRPYAWAFVNNELTNNVLTRLKIPIPPLLGHEIFRPYAYLPPGKIDGKTYGYYDCFGYSLAKFDDCGYLPFSLVVQENGVLVRKTPKMETVQVFDFNGEIAKFECYESWSPQYKCGVPQNYIFQVCSEWRVYLDKSRL